MNMSASDISKNSYVSVSTIYRIIDKLELSGLQAFKSHIHFDRERYQKELISVDYNYPFRINNTNHEIMTKMLNLYDQTLHSTLNLVNLDEFGKIVQKMVSAKLYSVPKKDDQIIFDLIVLYFKLFFYLFTPWHEPVNLFWMLNDINLRHYI